MKRGTMYIETIRIQNGRVRNIRYHNARCNRTRQEVYGIERALDLRTFIVCPIGLRKGLTKCRITYAEEVLKVEYEPYEVKVIKSLQLVAADHICYAYKSADRTALAELYRHKGEADDILMVKKGLLTDSFYANVGLLKNGLWYTPRSPMLAGTMRAQLLAQHRVIPCDISVENLSDYEEVTIFNAMIPFGVIKLAISSIATF